MTDVGKKYREILYFATYDPLLVSYRATRMCGNALLTRLHFLLNKEQIKNP
jgi:hypothetical protein